MFLPLGEKIIVKLHIITLTICTYEHDRTDIENAAHFFLERLQYYSKFCLKELTS